MAAPSSKTRIILISALAAVVVVVLVIKFSISQSKVHSGATSLSPGKAAVYLFYDESDHDADCREIYTLFDKAAKTLPASIASVKVELKDNQALYEKFHVRVLPTVLLVDPQQVIKQRIEGEGPAVQARITETFQDAQKLLSAPSAPK